MTCPGWSLRKNMKGSREGNMKDSAGKFTEGAYHCEPEESQVDVFDVRRFHNLQHNSQGQWPEGSAVCTSKHEEGTTTVVLCWVKYYYHEYICSQQLQHCAIACFPFLVEAIPPKVHDFANRDWSLFFCYYLSRTLGPPKHVLIYNF